jgi:heme A synthase
VLSRLLRGRRPDRNPLRRGSDRAETAMLGVLLAAFLAATPFAAHAAASWTYAASAREAQAQRAVIHQVQAILLQPATQWDPSTGTSEAEARWRAPDGQRCTAQLMAPAGAMAGSTVTVWTNQACQLTNPPLQHSQVVGRADISRVIAVVALAVTLIILGWLGRRALDRRRLAGWDADWLATGPRWSSRR